MFPRPTLHTPQCSLQATQFKGDHTLETLISYPTLLNVFYSPISVDKDKHEGYEHFKHEVDDDDDV